MYRSDLFQASRVPYGLRCMSQTTWPTFLVLTPIVTPAFNQWFKFTCAQLSDKVMMVLTWRSATGGPCTYACTCSTTSKDSDPKSAEHDLLLYLRWLTQSGTVTVRTNTPPTTQYIEIMCACECDVIEFDIVHSLIGQAFVTSENVRRVLEIPTSIHNTINTW